MDVDFQIKARPEDVVANKTFLASFFDCVFHDDRGLWEFLAEVDVCLVRAGSEAGDNHALDKLMRILVDDVAILKSARLGFIAIADEVNRLGIVRRNKCPFHAGGEARTAPAPKPGFLDLLGDVFWLHFESLFQIIVPAIRHVGPDGWIPAFTVNVLEDEPVFAFVWLFGIGNHKRREKYADFKCFGKAGMREL